MFDFLKNKVNDAVKKVEKAVTEAELTQETFDEVFWKIELGLLQSNVSSEVINEVKLELRDELVGESVKKDFKSVIKKHLRRAFSKVLIEEGEEEFLEEVRSEEAFVFMIVGVNGSGKTTTIAKLARYFQEHELSCVLAAGDTFRAASIEQLKHHGDELGCEVISSEYGSDSASVGYDAVRFAENEGKDVVLIDTAGRLQSDKNLMNELRKVKKVNEPDAVIFVADALTGNDVVDQAREFHKVLSVDYIILTKTDVDDKGGAVLSTAYAIEKPILFLGTGQEHTDLEHFNKEETLNKLF